MLEEILRTINNWFERDSLVGDLCSPHMRG